MKKPAVTCLLLFLSSSVLACSILEPKPDRTRSYLLTAQIEESAAARTDLALAVGPVDFPAYLDRNEMVTREGAYKLRFSDLDRWAEPLSDNFTRVFSTDLGNAVGTDNVFGFPTLSGGDADYRVGIAVEQLEQRDDGMAVLVARWQLSRGLRGEVLRRARSVHEVPVDGATAADAVDALSRATALLAEEIAAVIRTDHSAR